MMVGMTLVLIVPDLFPGERARAVIVALTIPLSLLFALFCCNGRGVPANLLSIGATISESLSTALSL